MATLLPNGNVASFAEKTNYAVAGHAAWQLHAASKGISSSFT
jgi:hypothetical protein